MLDLSTLCDDLESAGIPDWRQPLARLVPEKLSPQAHGHLPHWLDVLAKLPPLAADRIDLDGAAISVTANRCDPAAVARLRQLLLQLNPWRKGPFHLFGIDIDAEWRSNMKWDRLCDAVSPLRERKVLDVGCGNGYYAMRMKGAGAGLVIGIDPTLGHIAQFAAVQTYLRQPGLHLLPLRLQELPDTGARFDSVFSMGVLYHQRIPGEHLRQLRACLRSDGELVLESLVLPGDGNFEEAPAGRYARMRNVWRLPSVERLRQWLQDAGFRRCRVVNVSVTGTDEQRTTEWMSFESLDQALHLDCPEMTVEGLPRPRRALLICNKP